MNPEQWQKLNTLLDQLLDMTRTVARLLEQSLVIQ